MRKKYLEIGKIVAAQGLGGEFRVQYYCDSADVICSFDRLFMGKDKTEYDVEKARPHKTLAVIKLRGIDTVEQAKSVVGKMLYIDRDDTELPEGVHFIQDIIGLEVRDADSGTVYGKVTDIYQHGAADVYSLKTPEGKELMFPAIPEVLLETNIDGGYLVIRPLEGLFDGE